MRLPKCLDRLKKIINKNRYASYSWGGSFKMGDHIKTGSRGSANGIETGVIVGLYKPNLYMVRLDKWTDEQVLLMGGEDQAWIVLGAHEIWKYEPEYEGVLEFNTVNESSDEEKKRGVQNGD